MKKIYLVSQVCLFIFAIAFINSCKGQTHSNIESNNITPQLSNKEASQIGEYVVEIFEDSKGNLWFGSRVAEKDYPDPDKRKGSGGLVKYDGEHFTSFPKLEGLHQNDVYQIYKDSKENLWISTISNGMYKYDGEGFTNYPVLDPVTKKPKAVMSFLEDRKGFL